MEPAAAAGNATGPWLEQWDTAAGVNATLGLNGSSEGGGEGGDPSAAEAVAGSCLEWAAAQHGLFQAANVLLAAALLVPRSFPQSALLIRTLLTAGLVLAAAWAGLYVCAPDVCAWNAALAALNAVHAALQAAKHLPPPLSLELAELYLKVFQPLRVSRKHFRELTKEAQLLRLRQGEAYAVEDVTAADERLSVLLKGRLKVTCEAAQLHYIGPHQFIDSPEWEANRERSEDVFQVTITAEQDCVYLCWPRLRLERVLRHRPLLKTVLDSMIGKDITYKLYSLAEELSLAGAAAAEAAGAADRQPDHWRRALSRSLSADAVHTGTRGHVRSLGWRKAAPGRQKGSPPHGAYDSPRRAEGPGDPEPADADRWVPMVTASQFPANSPFAGYIHPPPPPPAAGAPAPGPAPPGSPPPAAAPLPTVPQVSLQPAAPDPLPAPAQRSPSPSPSPPGAATATAASGKSTSPQTPAPAAAPAKSLRRAVKFQTVV